MILYYFFSIMTLSLIGLLLRYFVRPKRNITIGLFTEALKKENSGRYEEAMISYTSALDEAKKTPFHGSMKSKIIQKLKVLHTIMEYKGNFHLNQRHNWY
ncbi:MAG: hypothetical protein Q8941_20975 [Bacteroidota bacterium]|nr:hypothetical protein [Bacteroidota bacterium]